MLAAWGRIVYRRRYVVLTLSALLLVASTLVVRQGGALSNDYPTGTEYDRTLRLMQQELPQAAGSSFTLIFGSSSLKVTDRRFRTAMQQALAPLRHDPHVASIRTPYGMIRAIARSLRLVSRDQSYALAIVYVKGGFNAAHTYYPRLRAMVHSRILTIVATDPLVSASDFDRLGQADLRRAESVSLPASLLLLLLVFGSLVAALLPLAVGILAVAGGIAAALLLTQAADVAQYALNIVTLIGLGVAIDYSLFVVKRFQEELAHGVTVENAVVRAMATAGRAITFSGLTAAIGLCGLLFYNGSFLASMGLTGTIVIALAVVYALTFLPASLAVLGPAINRWQMPLHRQTTGVGVWRRIATHVMRHPWLALVPGLAIVLVAGSPFLHIRLADGDVTTLPPAAESQRGYDLLRARFGQDQTVIFVVVYTQHGNVLSSQRVGALYDFSRMIARLPGVSQVESPVDLQPGLGRKDYQMLYAGTRSAWLAPLQDVIRAVTHETVGRHIVLLTVRTAAAPESDAARAIVRTIRAQRTIGDAQIRVTGVTAFDLDFIDFILHRTPAAVLFVALMTCAMLFALTRSAILPLKAMVMNLLSISASFGVLVWIFQEGHLSGPLHVVAAPIDPTLPIILFCITFGLSMDYEVLLLSRIQEEYWRSAENGPAVVEGLERSGALITGAATIMIAVFVSFALADVVIVKAVGLGLAVAVFVDATIVRALIVPAVMCLLGDLNWWAPRPLALTLKARHDPSQRTWRRL